MPSPMEMMPQGCGLQGSPGITRPAYPKALPHTQASIARPNQRTVCGGYKTLWQNTMRLLRIIPIAAVTIATVGLGGLPSFASRDASPDFGTCEFCCCAYPSGWRGMCVRRCHAYRQQFPRAVRRLMRCECSFNWRGEWTCGR
jgi:hypothetical protein